MPTSSPSSTSPGASRDRELLDEGDLTHDEVHRALDDLARTNRWLLGYLPVRRTLLPRLFATQSATANTSHDAETALSSDAGGPWLLDVGTGLGDVANHLARQAHRHGHPVRIVGLDSQLRHLLLSRRLHPHHAHVVACAKALPFAADAVDWSFSSLVFHHFDAPANARILAEMRRVARHGAVIVDLRRSPLLRLFIRPLLRILGAGPVARHDGIVSAAASWSIPRVRRLAKGHPILELRRRFPFRFSLVVDGRPDAPKGAVKPTDP